jgi:hypothetical protein
LEDISTLKILLEKQKNELLSQSFKINTLQEEILLLKKDKDKLTLSKEIQCNILTKENTMSSLFQNIENFLKLDEN